MIIAGHTLGTPGYELNEALRLFKSAALDAAEVIYQDDYPAAVRPFDKRSVQRAAASASAEGIPIVALTPYTTSINSLEPTAWQQELGADRVRVYAGRWQPGDADHAAHWEQPRKALAVLSDDAAAANAVMSRVVGSGVLPWTDIIGELTRRGYDDVLTLEYEYRWHPQDLPEPAVGFAESARVLRSILASLEDDR